MQAKEGTLGNLQLEDTGVKDGITYIAQERIRQLGREGWTSEHDDHHIDGQLAKAGAVYALPFKDREFIPFNDQDIPTLWPWDPQWYKPVPQDRIRELSKAGALIAAEIDRLIRLDAQTPQEHTTQQDKGPKYRLTQDMMGFKKGHKFVKRHPDNKEYSPEGYLYPIISQDMLDQSPWFEPLRAYPKSWGDYYSNLEPTTRQNLRKALTALGPSMANLVRLLLLRDAWWEDWEPDWEDPNQPKHIIMREGKKLYTGVEFTNVYPLAFPDERKAKDFLDCFEDKIKKTEPYL